MGPATLFYRGLCFNNGIDDFQTQACVVKVNWTAEVSWLQGRPSLGLLSALWQMAAVPLVGLQQLALELPPAAFLHCLQKPQQTPERDRIGECVQRAVGLTSDLGQGLPAHFSIVVLCPLNVD